MRTITCELLRWRVGLLALCLVGYACGDDGAAGLDPVYVDQSAEAGGDGSQARPFREVGLALDAVIPGGLVIVAPGSYAIAPSRSFDADVSLLGSIQAPTRFFAAESEDRIQWQASTGVALFMRDISFDSALVLEGGSAELNTISVTGTGPILSIVDMEANITDMVLTAGVAGSGDYAGDSLLVQQSTLRWDGGSAAPATNRALVSEASTLNLSDLVLAGTARGSMHVLEGSHVTGANLTLEDTAMAAFVLGSTLWLSESTVARTTMPAILVGTGASVRALDSSFADCPPGFIAAASGSLNLQLERNQFVGSANDNCVTASSDGLTAKDNTIDTCAGSGLLVLGSQDIEVSGNQVQNILYDKLIGIVASGISLSGVTGSVTGNTIHSTLDSGIDIAHSVVTIDANIIGPVGGSGVSYVDGPSAATTVSNNMISEATGAGIIALGATVNMTGNQIDKTAVSGEGFGDGIAFGSGALVNASANTLTDNAHNGILYLNGATGTVMGNTATGNAEFGLREICTGATNVVTVGTNTLTGNTLGEQTLCSP